MKAYIEIKNIKAREILDSRGNPTVEAEVYADGGIIGRASVPSGASTGAFEACELRDNDKSRYMGKGVLNAVSNINGKIRDILTGRNVLDQMTIDTEMCKADGTANKSKLGANAILAVSLACAKAASAAVGLPLYRYIGGVLGHTMPVPMMNIINGGRHADNSVNCQEFMIMPVGAQSFSEGVMNCTIVFHTLQKVLRDLGYSTAVGAEGGFAPNLKNDEEAIILILKAIEKAGFIPGEDFMLALDIASTEMYDEGQKLKKSNTDIYDSKSDKSKEYKKEYKKETKYEENKSHEPQSGKYYFWKSQKLMTSEELTEMCIHWTEKYPIISIEDPMAEEDIQGWQTISRALGDKVQLVGDDFFVTNPKRIKMGISMNAANSVLIKPNQIGTLTETIKAVNIAQKAGYTAIISHRSGETEDTSIADLAVALNSGQIKTGAPSRTDRTSKYNRLIRIEEELGYDGSYLGKSAFYNLKGI